MDHEDHRGKKDQLEEHSLPGTNQAGRGPDSCDEDDQDKTAVGGQSQQQDGANDRGSRRDNGA